MSFLSDGPPRRRWLRDALAASIAVAGVVVTAGLAGYGDFAATGPGVVSLALAGYLGLRVSRALADRSH